MSEWAQAAERGPEHGRGGGGDGGTEPHAKP